MAVGLRNSLVTDWRWTVLPEDSANKAKPRAFQ